MVVHILAGSSLVTDLEQAGGRIMTLRPSYYMQSELSSLIRVAQILMHE